MCTAVRFNDDEGNMYFGRNLDWTEGYGQKIVLTPRNYQYESAFLGKMAPKNGAIIGMAVVADNIPLYFDCANEAGLAVAGLNFPDYTHYEEAPVDSKTNIAAFEFPLWCTLNFSTVDEAEDALKNTAIVAHPLNENYPVSNLHFIISDKNRSIVVEYTENGMEISPNDIGVLTNVPTFKEQVEKLTDDEENLPGGWESTARFIRVAYLNSHYPTKNTEDENVLKLFHILSNVSVIEGAKPKDDGFEKTIYTGGYSTASRTYYYNTYESPTVMHVSIDDYNLDKSELTQI